jgi:KDO2-lipid IV(A) lauroyltransferase
LAYLPRSWNLALGSLGGRLFFRLNRRRQNIAVTNIKEAIKNQALDPDLDPEAVAKSSFANLGRTATESFCLLHRGLNYFKGHWTISGGESLQKALSECRESGRGIIFATAHLGNWELSSLAFSFQFDFVAAVVGRSQGGFLANEILTRIRTQDGTSFICKNGGAREMLKLLRSGRILGTLFDQADIVGHGGAKLDFMGKPALTTLGPLKLAARTGALIVPVFNRREGDHHFYEIHPTITPPVDWGQPWLLTTAQTLNNMLGDFIRRYPDQWMWGHRRWKTPEGLKEDPTSFG